MEKYLKKCTMTDFDILRELSIRTYYEAYVHLSTTEDMQAYLDEAFEINKLCKELNNSDSDFFLLYFNDIIAGYLKLNEAPSQTDLNDSDALEIERIYVAREFQGMGLGRYLIEQAINIAIERKKKYVWLGVWEKNKKAIHFYEKNGFYEINSHYFVMGEDVQTDYIMRKDLI